MKTEKDKPTIDTAVLPDDLYILSISDRGGNQDQPTKEVNNSGTP